jgi:uncharacterized repeat protein (TIGR02543 family)
MKALFKVFRKSVFYPVCVTVAAIAVLFPVPAIATNSMESGYFISQQIGETWVGVYQHQFQVQYRTESFSVDVVDGKVVLRIVQTGAPFADIDQINIKIATKDFAPAYARYTWNGENILDDISGLDNNVVLAHEREIEVGWDLPAGYKCVLVNLTANEYGHSLPFHFPENGYLSYKMGSNIGSITVDGLIAESDGTVPLCASFWRPDTGHPDGYTFIYLCDDEQYVYFSLDVTCDNTNEFGEDWAELNILLPDGSETAFRIDDFNATWGKPGFGLTSKVSYKHQTYEFAIPKALIGNGDVQFNLAYYGTAGVNGYVLADPEVYPLLIEINGSSNPGQVFSVGDELTIEGFFNLMARAQVNYNEYILETGLMCDLSLRDPDGIQLEFRSHSDQDDNEGSPGTTLVQTLYADRLSFTHTLTGPGEYTVWINSSAHADIYDLGHNHILGTSDYAQTSLSFTVGSGEDSTNKVSVNAEAGENSLAVPVGWSWDVNSGTQTTSFDVEDIPDGAELALTAPNTHIEDYTFYVFEGWDTDDDGVVDNITTSVTVNNDMTITAIYTPVIRVGNILDRCDNGEVSAPYDPDALPLNTPIYFGIKITIHAYESIEDVRMEDGLGADLTVTNPGEGTIREQTGKGKNSVSSTIVDWNLGDMGSDMTLYKFLTVWTSTNPKGKQQYNKSGEHLVNSGPVVHFTYNDQDYELRGPSIMVNVIELD